MKERLIYKLLQSEQTVFSLNEIALIGHSKETANLKSKINYYVKTGLLLNIHKKTSILHGLGELIDIETKTFVEEELKEETISLLNIYKNLYL